MKKDLDSIFENYNKIGDDDNNSIVEFVENHFSKLLSYQTEDLKEVEDISVIFRDYYSSLYQLGRFKTIIKSRDQVISYIERLKDKSKLFIDCYSEIEYVYSEALSISRSNYKLAISSLTKIHEIDPQDENIIIAIKSTRLDQRRSYYQKIIWTGLIIAFSGLIGRFFSDKSIFWIIDTSGFAIFVIGLLIQYIDVYFTNKAPSH